MKILVLSDSHKDLSNMSVALKNMSGATELVLHLGDCYGDALAFERDYPQMRFEMVRGNCDFDDRYPPFKRLEVAGKQIFMVHGHNFGVKSDYQRIMYFAMENGADICLFGHTHAPVIFEENGILFMNPGSISIPKGSIPAVSYGVLDIDENGAISASVVAKKDGLWQPVMTA